MPFIGSQQRTKTPVTIITGFLGAGKTTLLNHLLREKGQKSVGVIENEFGEVNIDSQLVAENLLEKEDLVSLENGCVCCSLRKDIVKAFAEIERRSQSRKSPIDAIVMETTGLADPGPVAFTFFANPWIASRFKLDSIMCVVDARHLLQHLEDGKHPGYDTVNEAVQQIAFSDVLLLNKIDLVTEEEKELVLQAVKKINFTARIIECQMNDPARCPSIDKLLGINSFSIDRALELDPHIMESSSDDESDIHDRPHTIEGLSSDTSPGPVCDSGDIKDLNSDSRRDKRRADDDLDAEQAADDPAKPVRRPRRTHKKLHDLSDISSLSLTARGALDEYRFNMYMRDLLTEKSKDIFRCKGVLCVHGYGNKKFVFQGVHETICYGPCDKPWNDDESKMNQLVFIGRGLDRKSLIAGFRSCVWTPLPAGWEEFQDPTTKKPYYVNKALKQKTWARPEDVSVAVNVTATNASIQQPPEALPRKQWMSEPASVPSS